MAFIISDFEEQVMREIDATAKALNFRAFNLGGVSGPNGGSGVPPGGFLGQLVQSRVTFDTTESTDPTIPEYGFSLVTNLNRIRAGVALGDGIIQLRHLASGLIVPTEAFITVEEEGGGASFDEVTTIVFDDSEITQIDDHTVEVNFLDKFLEGLALSGSGFSTRSWYINGALVSGVLNPDNVYLLPDGGLVVQVYSYTDSPGSSDLHYSIVTSEDGNTWTDIMPCTHPSGVYLYSGIGGYTIPAGMFVGVLLGESPTVPNTPFSDVTIVLETLEPTTGSELPEFTPKRVPFADNDTGTLTENPRFNFVTDNNSSVLIIGADNYTTLGSTTEKVALDIVREGVDGGLLLETYGSTGGYAPLVLGMRARGTRLSPEGLLNGDILFRFTGRGYAATGWSLAPSFSLKGVATEDWGDLAYGTKAVISVTKNGETTTTDIFTVDGDGLDVNGAVVADSADFDALKIPTGATAGYVLTSDVNGNATWQESSGGPGAVAFIDLTDVPSVYTGAGGYKVKVKGDETGLEFVEDTGAPAAQTKYEPDAEPLSPSDYDDEFNSATLDAKWTVPTYDDQFDMLQAFGGSAHLSTALHEGYLTYQGADIGYQFEFYQLFDPEDDNWTTVFKVSPGFERQYDSFMNVGFAHTDAGKYIETRIGFYDTPGIRVFYSDSGDQTLAVDYPFTIEGSLYVMFTKELTGGSHLWSIFVSKDGITWMPVDVKREFTTWGSTGNITMQYFGNYHQTYDMIHTVDFVRYFSDAYHFNIGRNP